MRFEYGPEADLIREAISREVEAAHLEGLEERVVGAIVARGARPLWRRLRDLLLPDRGELGIAAMAAGLLLAVGLGFLAGRLALPTEPLPSASGGGTVFALVAPGAHSVQVLGDFSAWQPIPLSDPEGDGIWTLVLDLPPGRYEYAYIVDGKWLGQDPAADEYVRTLGDYTSVRYIGGDRS